MGYNESYGPVRRMKKHLDELFHRRETVDFATDDPRSLAYRLREAIHAAQFWDDFAHYHELGEAYRFEVRADRVRCRYVLSRPVKVASEEEGTPQKASDKTVINDVDSLMGVIGAAMEHEDETEIYFPSAVLLDGEKSRLFGFAKNNDWKIIDHSEGGMTLTKKDVPEEVLWTP